MVLRLPAALAWGGAMIAGLAFTRAANKLSVLRLRAAGLEMIWRTPQKVRRVVRAAELDVEVELCNRDVRPVRFASLRAVASRELANRYRAERRKHRCRNLAQGRAAHPHAARRALLHPRARARSAWTARALRGAAGVRKSHRHRSASTFGGVVRVVRARRTLPARGRIGCRRTASRRRRGALPAARARERRCLQAHRLEGVRSPRQAHGSRIRA